MNQNKQNNITCYKIKENKLTKKEKTAVCQQHNKVDVLCMDEIKSEILWLCW